MIRNLLAMLLGMTLMACATVHQPTRPPSDVALAVIGMFECGEMKGIVVVAKDGSITPVEDISPDDLKALAAMVGPGSVGMINMIDNCPPHQKT